MTSVPSAEAYIENFPHSLPKLEGKPTYGKLKQLKNLLKQNAASVPSNSGGGDNGYLGIVLSDAAYAAIAPANAFVLPIYPGASANIPAGSTGPAIARIVQVHAERTRAWREHNNVSAALKKQFTGAIDPVYLRSQCNRNTGFANIALRDLITYCITTYGKISPADLASNETAIKLAWDADTPFELVIDQIEDCQDFADDGNQPFTDRQILNTAYTLVFNTGAYFDECKTWNAKPANEKIWENFKTHFLAAQETLRMQQETAQQGGFHGANAMQHAITQQMYEEQSVALANLATATSSDRKALETLTNTVANLTSELKTKDIEIKNLRQQMKQRKGRGGQENGNNNNNNQNNNGNNQNNNGHNQNNNGNNQNNNGNNQNNNGNNQNYNGNNQNNNGHNQNNNGNNQNNNNNNNDNNQDNSGYQRYTPHDMGSYCHSHGYLVWKNHNSSNCRHPKDGHKKEATRTNNMGGNQEGKP
jgi:hypothetical protein